eukprot:1529670-Amphidinium_carterae.2
MADIEAPHGAGGGRILVRSSAAIICAVAMFHLQVLMERLTQPLSTCELHTLLRTVQRESEKGNFMPCAHAFATLCCNIEQMMHSASTR